MLEHRYDIRISESCVDPNRLMVERQDQDNFSRLQTLERCAMEIAAFVFKNVEQWPTYFMAKVKICELIHKLLLDYRNCIIVITSV